MKKQSNSSPSAAAVANRPKPPPPPPPQNEMKYCEHKGFTGDIVPSDLPGCRAAIVNARCVDCGAKFVFEGYFRFADEHETGMEAEVTLKTTGVIS